MGRLTLITGARHGAARATSRRRLPSRIGGKNVLFVATAEARR